MLTTEAPGPAAGLGRRPTRADIDLGALARNVRALGRRSGRRVMAVVKADGYGHGAVPVARAARAAGAAWLGCATVAEGVELRRAGDAGPILVLGGFYPEEVDEALADALTPVVYGLPPRGGEAVAADLGGATLARLAAAGRRRGRAVPVHVKLDTGMRRLGLAPDELPAFLDRLDALNARGVVLQVEGLMSHLAAADDPGEAAYTAGQRAALDDALTLLAARGHAPRERHLDNSAGSADPWAAATLVRPGIALYGAHAPEAGLVEPVMTLASAVTALRDVPAGATVSYGRTFRAERPTRLAVVPTGYADGLPRALSSVGCALVRGRRAPIAGRVCMDWTMLDVTDLPGVAVGDPVVWFGRDGGAALPAEEVARAAGTLAYELFCGVGRRVPRQYVGAP